MGAEPVSGHLAREEISRLPSGLPNLRARGHRLARRVAPVKRDPDAPKGGRAVALEPALTRTHGFLAREILPPAGVAEPAGALDAADRAACSDYRARAKVGTVPVVVSPEDATILVDGKDVGKAPLADPVFLEPGEHLIEARRAGYTAKRATAVWGVRARRR